jgi:hypothetical protein
MTTMCRQEACLFFSFMRRWPALCAICGWALHTFSAQALVFHILGWFSGQWFGMSITRVFWLNFENLWKYLKVVYTRYSLITRVFGF